MNRWFLRGALVLACLLASTARCPAPVIYRPGEGWTYEPVGSEGAKWVRKRAKDQLQVAQEAFDQKQVKLALKAARRVVKIWPLSDHAGPAQYLIGRCYEERKMDERAFKEYQRALLRYPKLPNYDEVLHRQQDIAIRFLGGQWFKLWGYIPFFPSMDKTAGLFEQVTKNGPFNETGPKALMNVGAAREKQKNYPLAVKAYERAADRYHDRPAVAADALYKAGSAWDKQAKRAEYDQSIAKASIETFQDFGALYPTDPRVPGTLKTIASLRTEQARGAYETARFYERYKRWQGALVYYNEVLLKDASSPFAAEARARIEKLKPKAEEQRKKVTEYEQKLRASSKAAVTNAVPDKVERPEKR
ncbi:MAG: outer membrane protein assembly factor BamD [Verrucomicrobiota bacterium]